MTTSIAAQLKSTGDMLRIALEQRKTSPEVLIELMHDFSLASDDAFLAKNHNLVGFAQSQLKNCGRGFLRTLQTDSTPRVFATSLKLFPMRCDYLEDALEVLQAGKHAAYRIELLKLIFYNMVKNDTIFCEQVKIWQTQQILERGMRLSVSLSPEAFTSSSVATFLKSTFESEKDSMAMVHRAIHALLLNKDKKDGIEAAALLQGWVIANEDFLVDAIKANGISEYNQPTLCERICNDLKMPKLAAAIAFRTMSPTFELLYDAHEHHGMAADDTFRRGIIPTFLSSEQMNEQTLSVLIAYSLAFEDVMPARVLLEKSSDAVKSLRNAAYILNRPEYASLPRLSNAQRIVDLIVDAAPENVSMEPLAGCWIERFALNNLKYKARLFTQELGL